MFNFIKNFFKHEHSCGEYEKINIIFSILGYKFISGYCGDEDGISCYLHNCPKCGRCFDAGRAALLNGEKIGNYYAVRKSLRLANKIIKEKYWYKIGEMQGIKFFFKRKDLFFYLCSKPKEK